MAAADKPESAGATQTARMLRIDRRVLMTPSRTIAIDNVATVGVGTHVEPRPVALLLIGALALALIGFAVMQAGVTGAAGTFNLVTIGFWIAAVILAMLALKPHDRTHYLLISSSDGLMTRFTANDRSVLDEVRNVLTDKINRRDDTSVFDVDFANGRIAPVGASANDPQRLGPQAAPHQNQPRYAAAESQPSAGHFGDAARAAPGERTAPSGRSLGETLSQGRAANGAAAGGPNSLNASASTSDGYVDFRALLPAVVEMHRFYARQANTEHLEQRLSELELLMRAGAQTDGQKVRVRELTRDLGHILQAYQPAVQIFQQIAAQAA